MANTIFRVKNPAGTLVLDRNSPGVYYRGRAAFISTTAPSGSVGSLSGRRRGYSLFQFESATPVFAAVELKSGCVVRPVIEGQHRVGTTWSFWIFCGTSTLDVNGFADQAVPEVYVFGYLESPPGGIGLRLRNDSGVVTHAYTDLAPRPAWFKGRVSDAGAGLDLSTARAIPVMAKPAAVGWPRYQRTQKDWISTTTMRQQEWEYGWAWNSATPGQILMSEVKTYQDRDPEAGPPRGADSDVITSRTSDTLILDAAPL